MFRDFRTHPLSLAARGGHEDIVRFIIVERGVSPDMWDPKHRTPLSLAAIHGHVSLVRFLLGLGARQDLRSLVGDRPLSLAAWHGHEEIAAMLVSDIEERCPRDDGSSGSFRGQTEEALAAAITAGHQHIVRLLIKHGVRLDFFHNHGQTPLLTAAKKGDKDMVLLLLEHGADPNLVLDRRRRHAPLTEAAMSGHEDIVRILVQRTAGFHCKRALAFAVRQGNKRIAQILLENGHLLISSSPISRLLLGTTMEPRNGCSLSCSPCQAGTWSW